MVQLSAYYIWIINCSNNTLNMTEHYKGIRNECHTEVVQGLFLYKLKKIKLKDYGSNNVSLPDIT